MQARLPISTAIVVTSIVVSMFWMICIWQFMRMQRATQTSTVIAPMSALITDLNETARQEKHELLQYKLEVLAQHWEAFRLRKERPDGFWRSITELSLKITTKITEPNE